jgi:hypothetical protein
MGVKYTDKYRTILICTIRLVVKMRGWMYRIFEYFKDRNNTVFETHDNKDDRITNFHVAESGRAYSSSM